MKPLLVLLLSVLASGGCRDSSGPSGPEVDAEQARQIYLDLLRGEASAPADTATPARQRTGWATIRGTFRIEGQSPPRRRLAVNKDATICAPEGGAVLSQDILVDAAGNLANAVIYARDLSGENVHPEAQGATDEVEFDQEECIFLSHVQVMQVSQPLKIINSDSIGHNTNIQAARAGTFNESLAGGTSAIYQPRAAETVPAPVTCSIHPWMKAYLLPLENAYGAASGADGTFTIKNLPAGIDIEFQLWHELSGSVSEVSINGQPTPLNRGRLTLRLEPDEVRNLEIVIPAAAFR